MIRTKKKKIQSKGSDGLCHLEISDKENTSELGIIEQRSEVPNVRFLKKYFMYV